MEHDNYEMMCMSNTSMGRFNVNRRLSEVAQASDLSHKGLATIVCEARNANWRLGKDALCATLRLLPEWRTRLSP